MCVSCCRARPSPPAEPAPPPHQPPRTTSHHAPPAMPKRVCHWPSAIGYRPSAIGPWREQRRSVQESKGPRVQSPRVTGSLFDGSTGRWVRAQAPPPQRPHSHVAARPAIHAPGRKAQLHPRLRHHPRSISIHNPSPLLHPRLQLRPPATWSSISPDASVEVRQSTSTRSSISPDAPVEVRQSTSTRSSISPASVEVRQSTSTRSSISPDASVGVRQSTSTRSSISPESAYPRVVRTWLSVEEPLLPAPCTVLPSRLLAPSTPAAASAPPSA